MVARRVILALLSVFLLGSTVAVAQAGGAACSLEGGWFGGYPGVPFPFYTATFTALSGNRYLMVVEYGPEIQSMGYLNATLWKGELTKKSTGAYTGVFLAQRWWDPQSPYLPAGVNPNLPEMDFVVADPVELIDCNTFRITYTFWFVYYNYTNDIIPMVTEPAPPGFMFVLGAPALEYHRVPANCPLCASPEI